MSKRVLIRLSGAAAIAAGALRVGSSFLISAEAAVGLEVLYLAIDLFILFGLLGIYAHQYEESGRTGFLGFVTAVAGTAIIAGPDGQIGDLDSYGIGVLLISIGLILLAVGSWKARLLPRAVPALWIVSTVLGFVALGTAAAALFIAAGVAFGASFVIAGSALWKAAGATA